MNDNPNLRPTYGVFFFFVCFFLGGGEGGVEDRKINISMCTDCVVCVGLDMPLIIYVLRRLRVWGLKVQK